MKYITSIILFVGCLLSCTSADQPLRDAFRNPDNQYRPMPFWHINGELTSAGIQQQLADAKQLSGFGGVTVLPINAHTQWGTGLPCPGTSPTYLSDAYFDRYADILKASEQQGTQVILYDDVDFPSGSAGGRLQKEYPQYMQKFMVKEEVIVKGAKQIRLTRTDTSLLMAVSAMNLASLEVIDLAPFMKGTQLTWNAPAGDWRVMFFACQFNKGNHVDFMQPEAVDKVLSMTYDEYAKRFSTYFGNVITKTFYDDVGFVHQENVWTPAITSLFKTKYGKNPALYYPALFYDIGSETQAARVAFFDIRSELMAEGYVRKVSEWSAKHKLRSMGHPPENYSPNSVVAHGDILKYYRHTQIPLMDAIFFYGRGIHGFKQISSAADLGDKPEVGAEIYGAFPANADSVMLYRVAMEVMARGINFIVPHGMWYNSEADKIRIPPLISHQNPLLGKTLPSYSTYIARSCMMLQGGKRVSDIALLWPITAIQAETYINRDAQSGLPVANWLPQHVNHRDLSNLLTNQLHRDFTYIHPEDLCNGKIVVDGKDLKLNNTTNVQHYKVLLMPGGEVISAETLKAIKRYYDQGGKVIATASLASRSSEFGRDQEVRDLMLGIFGVNSADTLITDIHVNNKQGGKAAFIATANKENMDKVFAEMEVEADVFFANSAIEAREIGYVNYIHKQKDGKNIYFISNSTDHPLTTEIYVRGSISPELWNPYTGEIQKEVSFEHVTEKGIAYTKIKLSLQKVSSIFVVGELSN